MQVGATWPFDVPFIHYGEDNCLYDCNSNQYGCCSDTSKDSVVNPYHQFATQPPADEQLPLLSSANDGNFHCVDRNNAGGTDAIRTHWTAGSFIVMGERLSAD